jgi:hypothetical protein
MATLHLARGCSLTGCPLSRRLAISLIELLVVLFIIGVLLALLLPAVLGARHRMQATVCQNNIREVSLALQGCVQTTKRFPEPNRWTVDILKWMEEWPLADAMAGNADPNAEFPRPRLFRCPMQEDFSSRVHGVGFCHYILTVDRLAGRKAKHLRGEIHDRELLSSNESQEPWYVAPELTGLAQQRMFAIKPGPHPPGFYMTSSGLYPR